MTLDENIFVKHCCDDKSHGVLKTHIKGTLAAAVTKLGRQTLLRAVLQRKVFAWVCLWV